MEENNSRKRAISLKNVSKLIDGKIILQDLTFDIFLGEILAIIGPNGAGKTTTLRIVTGILDANSGVIEKNGNLRLSALSEKDFLWDRLTGYENIRLYCKYFNGSSELGNYYSERLGLKDYLNKRVYTYSKGTKRKLSLLLSLLLKPQILILDEPMTGLDPISRKNTRDLLFELKENGVGILLTSHDLAEVEKCADRFILINNGKIIANDLVWDTLSKYKTLEDLFFELAGGDQND
ncbi:MAG: ABC transporter ATP-binding protein [Caldisericum sp.]|jgi:ABC-2 type transport system ATP-binding protein|uniref:ABC transporter ATP-binding protein n=1 Tax=Caldisericum sp. TaxID=2499687 RepID=UPI003D0C1548